MTGERWLKIAARPWFIPAVTLIVPLAAGCATHELPQPRDTLSRYVHALRRDAPHEAYRLLSHQLQRQITRDDFTRRWRETQTERQRQATAFAKAIHEAPPHEATTITAKIAPKGSPPLRLAYVEGRWLIVSGADVGAGGATPRETLTALLDAAVQRNYLAARRLVVRSISQSIEREIDKRVKKIRDALEKAKIEIRGDHARLRFRGYKIELHRGKDGRWRISDFD